MTKQRTFSYINEKQVKQILSPRICNRLIQRSFSQLNRGSIELPPKIYLNLPHGDFRAMPVYKSFDKPSAGIKWISVFPQNAKTGIPSVIGTILINSTKTGKLLSVIEANSLTAYRTGAAGAVASKTLANRNSKSLTIVGAGVQAEYQLLCHLEYFKFHNVYIWSPDVSQAASFTKRLRRLCKCIKPANNLEEAVRSSDIIITCTPSRLPIIKSSWVKYGTHINAIGADAAGKQELEAGILKKASVFVDEWTQASHSGEINVPLKRGQISKKHIKGSLSDALQKKYSRKPNEITVFDSTGLAIQDIVVAQYVYQNSPKTAL